MAENSANISRHAHFGLRHEPTLGSPVRNPSLRFSQAHSLQNRWVSSLDDGIQFLYLRTLTLEGPMSTTKLNSFIGRCTALTALDLGPIVVALPIMNLRTITTLRSVVLRNSNTAAACYLPPQVSSLHVHTTQKPGYFINTIASYCPNLLNLELTSQTNYALGDLMFSRLTNLESLRVPCETMERLEALVMKTDSVYDKLVGALRKVLPTPRNSVWRRLEIGPFNVKNLMGYWPPPTVKVMREYLALGLRPTIEPFCPIRSPKSAWLRKEYLDFLFTECGVDPRPCDCPTLDCDHTSFFASIPLMTPDVARYIISDRFLPAVEAKARRTGRSTASVASALLANFQAVSHKPETVLEYLRNSAYPLDLNYLQRGREVIFFNLESQSAREALVLRAKEENVQLQLFSVEYDGVGHFPKQGIVLAAQLDQKFFVKFLPFVVELATDEEMQQLLSSCTLGVSEKSGLVRAEAFFGSVRRQEMMGMNCYQPGLFGALELLFAPEQLADLINEAIVAYTFTEPSLESALELNISLGRTFDSLRGGHGENWLHHQLHLMLDKLEWIGDKSLLSQVDAAGNTPLHLLCTRVATSGDLILLNLLEPMCSYIGEHGIWGVKNKAGRRAMDVIEFLQGQDIADFAAPVAAVLKAYAPACSPPAAWGGLPT